MLSQSPIPIPLATDGPPIAGVVTVGQATTHSIAATATPATGGVGDVRAQWQYQWPRDGLGWRPAIGTGTNSLSAVVRELGPCCRYELRVAYTDSASNVAYSTAVSAPTPARRFVPRRATSTTS
jgi:hypothetical protein